MRLDGFGIMVDDMSVMVRFYRDVLGFEIKEEEDTSNVSLQKDETLFLLYRKTDFEKMTGRKFSYCTGVNDHYEIALSVETFAEVDAAFSKVVAAGAEAVMEPTTEPTTEPWGCRTSGGRLFCTDRSGSGDQRTCFIADPEGNLIEIGSFVKE